MLAKLFAFFLLAFAPGVLAARPQGMKPISTEYIPKAYNTTRPLIGILSQPCSSCPGKSYIAAGYLKWIEMSGGRAVPIRFYDSDEELTRLFKSINGLIFPGGLTWLWLDSPYVIAARKLFNMAVAANKAGDVFPIHGTCLGHQLLHILASNVSRNDLLVDTDAVAHPTTLKLTPAAATSRFFGGLPEDIVSKVADSRFNIALENHMYGIPPSHYDRWPVLKEWYTPLSTTLDRKGVEYVSTMEGKEMPFSGTQWHPEKPACEFGMEEVPHSLDAIRLSQHLANVFMETARRSAHKPASMEEELNMVIYNTKPVFSLKEEVPAAGNYDGPDMTYYFDKHDNITAAEEQKLHRQFWLTQKGIY
eukprot:CAMPEP_0175075468 /NCGR_PEP_ID=MMETSP0052_2-20121109/22023_1 /TAXON_ID=51329 ORGANISM="Polytomella parva, Strain SAG 63-3" /NCGR_SAMPLE_ID=MMETSP0052_2 /ASSEMBLY_ACC=CAM_ASM_000194 /LENGTH=361 /DNA_ID=CAMNT_0016344169 /DNA_START=117 /DNA_END=1202 /DNA_ORIENTATION=+